jgi:hypothetical protein
VSENRISEDYEYEGPERVINGIPASKVKLKLEASAGSVSPDSLEELRLSPEVVARLHAAQATKAAAKSARPRAAKAERDFARIYIDLVPLLAKTLTGMEWGLLICLTHQMVRSKGQAVPATAKTTGCASRVVRHTAIRKLETLGLASVERLGPGQAVLVKLKYY